MTTPTRPGLTEAAANLLAAASVLGTIALLALVLGAWFR